VLKFVICCLLLALWLLLLAATAQPQPRNLQLCNERGNEQRATSNEKFGVVLNQLKNRLKIPKNWQKARK